MTSEGDGVLAPFSRTSRLILAARLRRNAGLIVAVLVLLGGWFAWLMLGHVSLYASSQQMKLESDRLPIRIEAPVQGVIADCSLVLGRAVEEGAVLVRLDARVFELQRDELQAELKANQVAIDAITQQLEAEGHARDAVAELAKRTKAVGNAKLAASRTSSLYKEKETAITQQLRGAELTSELEMIRARGETESLRAQVMTTAAQAALDSTNGTVNVSDRDARVAALQTTLADAQALAQVNQARLQSAEFEIERRSVRANAPGTLVDVTSCTSGMAIQPQQVLGTLLPHSSLRAVSFFRPEDAVGRVWPGAQAKLRIDNFPWTQYGTIAAVVDRVGSEARDGLVRVELRIDRPNPAIPMVHGLTGIAEVHVEQVAPFRLLLRMGGQLLSPRPDSSQPPPVSSAQALSGATR
jgi:multidrug resistance efflux pump